MSTPSKGHARTIAIPDGARFYYELPAEDDIANCDFVCEICGEHNYVPSKVSLTANYGSARDGEQLMLRVCGQCLDKIFKFIETIE